MDDTYGKLIALLNQHGAAYRLIDHPPEGQTDKVSALRGHPVAAAAKCIVLIAKLGKKATRFVLAVVPGDARVDTGKVRALLGATYVGFAATEVAERLAGSVAGTVLPLAFHPDLSLVVDPSLQDHPEIFFNAACLDRSVALRTADYLALAKPRLERVTAGNTPAALPDAAPACWMTTAGRCTPRIARCLATKAESPAWVLPLEGRYRHVEQVVFQVGLSLSSNGARFLATL